MPVPSILLSHIVVAPRGQEDRLCNAKSEHIELVASAIYPSKYVTLSVADRKHAILDERLVAVLVELPEAHYIVAQSWDVVHPRQRKVLPVLAGEQDATDSVAYLIG